MKPAAIVAKNKDWLMGYITGMINSKNKAAKVENELEGNVPGVIAQAKSQAIARSAIVEGAIFDIHCKCGYYVAFKSWDDVPDKNLRCELCPEYLIYYKEGNNENQKSD